MTNHGNEALWMETLRHLAATVPPELVETWLCPLTVRWCADSRRLSCTVPNQFYCDWVGAHYEELLVAALAESLDEDAPALSDPEGLGATPARPKPALQWSVDAKAVPTVSSDQFRQAFELRAPQPLRLVSCSTPDADLAAMEAKPGHQGDALANGDYPKGERHGMDRSPAGHAMNIMGGGASPAAWTSAARSTDSGSYPRGMRGPAATRPSSTSRGQGASEEAAALMGKLIFDNFIVGPSNQLAHAACSAAASQPGSRYNPLFMYSGVGLGKTHLLHAIGNAILDAHPEKRVRYVSAEQFTNAFIAALRNNRIEVFRQEYRYACDVLLVDDVQFLAGREQTQEEFFHTFNALYHRDCQIVLSSDVVPQALAGVQERLVSRFRSGLVVDLQPPEAETRVAILQHKAEQEGLDLRADVAFFLAEHVKSNVRELEGTLLRLAVHSELLGKPMNLALARQVLGEEGGKRSDTRWSIEDIQKLVCEHFRLKVVDLRSSKRARSISHPRMVAMYLCRQVLGATYPDIGERFGGKDHTTAMNAVRKVASLIESDPDLRQLVAQFEERIA